MFPLIKATNSFYFFHVGLISIEVLWQHGRSYSVRSNARKGARWSSGSRSTRSWSNACDKFATIDLISEIQRSYLHSAIGESWIDMRLHVDAPMKIKWQKLREVEPASWGSWPTSYARHGFIWAIQLFKRNRQPRFKLGISSINWCSLLINSWLSIKLRIFGGRSWVLRDSLASWTQLHMDWGKKFTIFVRKHLVIAP